MYAAGDAGGAAVMVLGDTAWALVLDQTKLLFEARRSRYDNLNGLHDLEQASLSGRALRR